jgi:capsular polysaccharide transport system ATP-binding protein
LGGGSHDHAAIGVQKYQTRHGLRTVLRDISFTIGPSEKIGILGRNGAANPRLSA